MKHLDIRIESWGDEFVVVGYIDNMTVASVTPYKTFLEALREVQRLTTTEVMRYESGLRRFTGR